MSWYSLGVCSSSSSCGVRRRRRRRNRQRIRHWRGSDCWLNCCCNLCCCWSSLGLLQTTDGLRPPSTGRGSYDGRSRRPDNWECQCRSGQHHQSKLCAWQLHGAHQLCAGLPEMPDDQGRRKCTILSQLWKPVVNQRISRKGTVTKLCTINLLSQSSVLSCELARGLQRHSRT